MKKKTYITPATQVVVVEIGKMIAVSITGVDGADGLGLGDDWNEGSAGTKDSGDWDIWGNGSDDEY